MRRALEWLGGSFLVYFVLAACSGSGGGGTMSSAVPHGSPGTEAASGQASGSEPEPAAGRPSGTGGLLDPVPSAMAAGGGGNQAGSPQVPFTKTVVTCSETIRVNTTDYPAAILPLDPPSLIVAATTIVVAKSTLNADDGSWVQAGSGGLVYPDGSKIGCVCAKPTDSVTFFVPVR